MLNEPSDLSDVAAEAKGRARLRALIADEHRRRRRSRFLGRAVVSGAVFFAGLTFVPPSPNLDVQPLLGLADAVQRLPTVAIDTGSAWYSRSEKIELVSIPVEGAEVREFRILLPSVVELWVSPGVAERRATTYGQPQFLSPEDQALFSAARLGDTYPIGQTIREDGGRPSIVWSTVTGDEPDDAYAVLRRQVAGVGDKRSEEVRMLRLAADLMRQYGGEPSVRSTILRVIADIPGIEVAASDQTIDVMIDYLDGDKPLRLAYEFDATSAHLVRESLAVLATQSEPSVLMTDVRHHPMEMVQGVSES